MKMAYKNVHKIIQRLLALNLLTKAKKPKSRDNYNNHNAIYFKLSEVWIFMLFLTRHHGILSDQLSTMRVKNPTILMDKQFVTCYKDCKLFETFILPVIRSEPLRLLNKIFLIQICEYLHQLLSLRMDFELEDVSLDEYIGGTKIKVIPESKDELEISNPHAKFKIKMRLDIKKEKSHNNAPPKSRNS